MNAIDFVEALKGKSELKITTTGRRTKKAYSATVWFLHENEKLYLLPVRGSDTDWYKNALTDPNVTLTVAGVSIHVKAEAITGFNRVQRVIESFAKKYGGMNEIKRWYQKLDVAIEIATV